MPYFGVHESISGGHHKAVSAAADAGFGCRQSTDAEGVDGIAQAAQFVAYFGIMDGCII
jgi:hypothetical protein